MEPCGDTILQEFLLSSFYSVLNWHSGSISLPLPLRLVNPKASFPYQIRSSLIYEK